MSAARRRLLIVNPNASAAVTRWLADEARRLAGESCEITAVNAASGLAAIQTPDDVKIAAGAVASAVAQGDGADGAIVAAFGDPGLEAARALNRMPVVGLGESGILAAARGGVPFSIVTLGTQMREPILAKVGAMGLGSLLAGLHVLPFSIPDLVADRGAHGTEIEAAVRACADGTVILGGAPFAGLASALARQTGRNVLDGVAACLDRLGSLAR